MKKGNMYALALPKELKFEDKFQIIERRIEETQNQDGWIEQVVSVTVRPIWYISDNRPLGDEEDIKAAIKAVEDLGFINTDFYISYSTINGLVDYNLEFRRGYWPVVQ